LYFGILVLLTTCKGTIPTVYKFNII